ncbi:extracellular solute-binding protein [Streptomyces sp. NPDC060198]|uniref:extracellular solute-binding protein n=1 Tax=Streptomyces sp. NPDC060198 TaxID=3347070 RepID=UPI00364C061C
MRDAYHPAPRPPCPFPADAPTALLALLFLLLRSEHGTEHSHVLNTTKPSRTTGVHRRTAAVVAALIGALSACGGDVGADNDTLRITANVTDRVSMDAVVAAFGRLDPAAKVSVTYAETGQLQQNLPAQLASDDGPDVFTVWPGNGNPASVTRLQAEGRLYDLSARRFAVDHPEDLRRSSRATPTGPFSGRVADATLVSGGPLLPGRWASWSPDVAGVDKPGELRGEGPSG